MLAFHWNSLELVTATPRMLLAWNARVRRVRLGLAAPMARPPVAAGHLLANPRVAKDAARFDRFKLEAHAALLFLHRACASAPQRLQLLTRFPFFI